MATVPTTPKPRKPPTAKVKAEVSTAEATGYTTLAAVNAAIAALQETKEALIISQCNLIVEDINKVLKVIDSDNLECLKNLVRRVYTETTHTSCGASYYLGVNDNSEAFSQILLDNELWTFQHWWDWSMNGFDKELPEGFVETAYETNTFTNVNSNNVQVTQEFFEKHVYKRYTVTQKLLDFFTPYWG